MKAKRLITFLLALCLIASFFVGTLPQAYAAEKSQGLGTVSLGKGMENKTAPVYDKPNGKSFTSLKHGTQVSILDQVKDENGNQWYKIRYTPKVEGYMPKSQISFDNPNSTSTTAKVGFVNEKVTSNLRVRSKPSEKDFKTIELLYAGDKVTILSTETIDGIKWYKIRTEKGNEGWCKSEYITQGSTKKEPSSSNSPSYSKLKKETIVEKGTIISWAQIYTSIDPKKVLHSKSFIGGEGVSLSEPITDSKGNQYYYFEFGKLTGYIDKDKAIRVSEEEFHGRPLSVDASKKGTVNKLVTSNLMVRSSPSEKDFTVLDRLYCGDQVSIIQITTINQVKWYRILTEGGIEGWVKAQYVNEGSNKTHQNNSTAPSSTRIPSTKGKTSYLAANSAYNNVRTPAGDIVKGIPAGTLFRCYGKCDYDPDRVWIDLDGDKIIDGSIIRGSVCKVNIDTVIVSISEQKLYVLRNYKVIFTARCITGNKGTKDTNLGVQAFIELKPGTWMTGTKPNGDPYKTWTDFWMQFNDCEEAIHNSTKRKDSDYTPYTYDGNGSYGCVNVNYDTAKTLYNNYAYMGEQVIVTMSTSSLFR